MEVPIKISHSELGQFACLPVVNLIQLFFPLFIQLTFDRAGNESHHIIGQRACLVTHQMRDLAEVFVQITAIADGKSFRIFEIAHQLLVVQQQLDTEKADQFWNDFLI